MSSFWQRLFEGNGLAPHGYCLLWQPELIWTHVIADLLIAGAYFSIPVAIVRFVSRRHDLQFSWIFWLFALFILACGTTHLMGIWTLWNADYGWEALIKVVTAIASVGTAMVLWPLIPKALAIPSPLQLKQANVELSARVRERDVALGRLKDEMAERERAEAALLQAQKMEAVGQLTGGIAHDFNNLLQAIAGNLDLISRNPGDEESVRRWSDRARQAADRGSRLTAQLLAFSRTQKLELTPVPVAPLVADLKELLHRTMGQEIEIAARVEDERALVLADKTQLELALMNLLLNARDAMPGGGTASIAVRRRRVGEGHEELVPGDYVEIAVSDTGTGMEEEVAERAFEPFFTTKGVGKGTGLGLSMVYGIATQSGGSADIDTVAGEGTTVTLTLRRIGDAAEQDAEETRDEEALAGEGTVMLVDDDEDVRVSMQNTLEALGYDVICAASGQVALRLLAQTKPDLLILDFAMPEMNGAEVAQRVAQTHPDLPIIFATGYADSAALEKAVGPGAAVLRKPFRVGDLAIAAAEAIAGAGD
ncbi:MAG: response regulator [Sphingomonadaceae bacterium]